MLTRFMEKVIFDLVSGGSTGRAWLNDDERFYEDLKILEARNAKTTVPFYLRILPRALRTMFESRQYENALIERWQISPHLLDDMGIILGERRVLPDHLIPAPSRVLDFVAAKAPEQVVAAELAFPQAVQDATVSKARAKPERDDMAAMAFAH